MTTVTTTPTISDAFELPGRDEILAMRFVVKLAELERGSPEVKQLVDDYVVTPAVSAELPKILGDLRQVVSRGDEYGRFIHGSFGSGKSHFMTMLSLLLEGDPHALAKFRPFFKAGQGDDGGWLGDARLLVVRIHMLSVRGRSTGLDRAIYDGFNAALKKRGKAPFEFLNLESLFDEARSEAERYGDLLWKNLEAEGIVGSRAEFEAIATGSPKGRERFAEAWLRYKRRDAASAGIDPNWTAGLQKMTEHAKAQGFGGIVLLIDEYLLWLAEKSGQEFIAEINNLNLIVDHTTGHRALPVAVFVARQRDLREFFPDLVDESKIHEHLDHHAKRFEITRLQDVELRHIVSGRVLRARDPAAVKAAIESLRQTQEKVLPALLSGGDMGYLEDVYPFHPALIEMLVDVTSLMQRERSALRLLYELLVVHYPTLPLGQFLPVGSAFQALFPESGVEASKKVELMQEIHHQYYLRLAPAMRQMADEPGSQFTSERHRSLDQLVKTVLLAEVSPRLRQTALTVERLVQLNSADAEGETFRGKVRVGSTDLLELAKRVPELQVAGSDKTAMVRYVLARVSLSEFLARAKGKVDNPTQRFRVFWAALRRALGIDKDRGFEEGGSNDGDYEIQWRRTRRRGRLKLGNVRELPNDDFMAPDGAFTVLIDYPWDDPGHSVDEDRLRANNVKKNRGVTYTACWLPRHMTVSELSTVTELAAVRYLMSEAGQAELLDTVGPQDRSQLLDQAGTRGRALEGQLDELLREVYVQHGEFLTLMSDVSGARPHATLSENLHHIATLLLDRRYPQHPDFEAEPKKGDLELLLYWMLQASDTNVSVGYEESTGRVLRTLGKPLELVNLGQTKASLRLDTRYVKDVLQRTEKDSVSWNQVADHLRETYGFQPVVIDLFLAFLCQRDHRALEEPSGERVDVKIGMPLGQRIRLQRGRILEAAAWHRLRELGHDLFGGTGPSTHRSLQGQDRYALQLAEAARRKREVLQVTHTALDQLGVKSGARRDELALANRRLAPLVEKSTDSWQILTEFLAAWPVDETDTSLRAVIHGAEVVRDAVAAFEQHTREHLLEGRSHPAVGPEVVAHLESMSEWLSASNAMKPLKRDWASAWNQDAKSLVRRLIQPAPVVIGPKPDPVPPPVVPPTVPTPGSPKALLARRINPRDPDDVSDYLGELRKAIAALPDGGVRLELVLVPDGEP